MFWLTSDVTASVNAAQLGRGQNQQWKQQELISKSDAVLGDTSLGRTSQLAAVLRQREAVTFYTKLASVSKEPTGEFSYFLWIIVFHKQRMLCRTVAIFFVFFYWSVFSQSHNMFLPPHCNKSGR